MLDWLKRTARCKPASVETDRELFDDDFQRRLETLAIAARRAHAGKNRAERRSKKIGSGVEFADHREYVPGDDFRHVDWNAYQRLGRLLVRVHQEEEDLSVYVLLDTSRSMAAGSPDKLWVGKRIAAAVAYIALANLDRVSVQLLESGTVHRLAPTRGKRRIFTILDFLKRAEARGRTALADSIRTFTTQNKRRGVVVLISDLYDPSGFEAGLNQLRYAKFEPHVIQIVDSNERRLDLAGDVVLVDDETGERREVTITPALLERYEAACAELADRVGRLCREKQVPHHVLDVGTPFDESMLRILRTGGLLT